LNTEQVLTALRDLPARHEGDERELLEALDSEAEGWRMRLSEPDDE
jgi:hypothetical protein